MSPSHTTAPRSSRTPRWRRSRYCKAALSTTAYADRRATRVFPDEGDTDFRLPVSIGFGLNDLLDVEGRAAFSDDLTSIGGDGEYWLLKNAPLNLSFRGGLHWGFVDGEVGDTFGVDVTVLGSAPIASPVELIGALDMAFNSMDIGDDRDGFYDCPPRSRDRSRYQRRFGLPGGIRRGRDRFVESLRSVLTRVLFSITPALTPRVTVVRVNPPADATMATPLAARSRCRVRRSH